MIETKLTATALALARKVHAGQTDKAGQPYIEHVLAVAERMDTEEAVCTAVLHDVLEDGGLVADDLRAAGMPEPVVEAVALLTHDPAVDYYDYIREVAANPLAAKVKHADLEHNADITRLPRPTSIDMKRRSKYIEALSILEGKVNVAFETPGWVGSYGYAVVPGGEGRAHAPAPKPPAAPRL